MEGAALSGMLDILANKLAPLVIKQYSSIVGVTKDLRDLQGLVEEINCWLEKAEYKTMDSGRLFNWLRQLKHVVYDIDDIVDEFHLEAEKHESHGGNHTLSKWLITKPKSFLFQCKAAHKIKAIKERLAAIVKQRTDISAIVNSVRDGLPVPHINRTAREIPTLPSVHEASVHGRDQEKHKIISKLVDNNSRPVIKIVSIIGLGGCGKTTLAKLVFNDGNIVKGHFEVRIWIHVSQEFDVEKLIEKMFEAISGEKSGHYPLQEMTKIISDELSGKRYLLVLDDVWTEDRLQWDEFIVHINGGAPGSSILLTTRSRTVAEAVESTDLFNLLGLSDVDSWALFSQSFGVAMNGLDSEFLEVGREIVNRCGGVPLAIKVLAGVLHDKRWLEEWRAIRDSNLLDVEAKKHKVSACLRLSYFHLPSHLKQCFTVCSLFPKGHRIYKEQLIKLWIAHNMINLSLGVNYLEDIGDEHFNSLVQVSFLQDVDEDDGRVICKMHDLVHDLAQSILREEISTNVPNDADSSTKSYRYYSLIERPRKVLPKKIFHNARAIYVDEGNDIFINPLENAKHLHSIILNSNCSAALLAAIFQIKYLKYLEISQLQCESLPEAISDIWSLQAVHLIDSSLLELPKSIGKLQKLRALNLSLCEKLKCLPDSIGDCHMISSIDLCNCQNIAALPNTIGRNEKLRVLRLGGTGIEKLPLNIATLRNLECLDLRGCGKLVELPEGIGNLKKLQVLNLEYCLRLVELPESISKLEKLQVLKLDGCQQLVELPEGIGNLEKLQVLSLDSFQGLVKLPEGINELEKLQVLNLEGCRKLVELPEGIGNLEKLLVLNLKRCEKLRGMPVGIGQLSRLEKLSLFVVGEGEKCAGISELADIGRDSEGLIIRGIEHVLEQDDAHKACLKWKTNLQRLKLEWVRYDKDEVNTEVEEGVLDGLEPPPGIEELEISGYSGRKYAQWMQDEIGGEVKGFAYFQFLRVMKLSDFLKLRHLHGLVELRCLEKLGLHRMPSLESISGGPFPSLVKLEMVHLHSLGEVWMIAERIMSDGKGGGSRSNCAHHSGQVQVGNCLTYLDMMDCPKLKMKTFLPLSGHLTHWELTVNRSDSSFGCSRLRRDGLDWVLRQDVPKLKSLDILFSDALTEVPESLGSLASLQSLDLSYFSNIHKLPECLGAIGSLQRLSIWNCNKLSSLPQSMGQLTSLQYLRIAGCNALHELPGGLGDLPSLCELNIDRLSSVNCFPESMRRLTSLKKLYVHFCPGLTSLPQGMEGMASLENLCISWCQGIESLPEGIKSLTALNFLEISGCPNLVWRCRREGEDWHLISHIPHVRIH